MGALISFYLCRCRLAVSERLEKIELRGMRETARRTLLLHVNMHVNMTVRNRTPLEGSFATVYPTDTCQPTESGGAVRQKVLPKPWS